MEPLTEVQPEDKPISAERNIGGSKRVLTFCPARGFGNPLSGTARPSVARSLPMPTQTGVANRETGPTTPIRESAAGLMVTFVPIR